MPFPRVKLLNIQRKSLEKVLPQIGACLVPGVLSAKTSDKQKYRCAKHQLPEATQHPAEAC